MTKNFKFYSMALAALVLGACSSTDDVVDAGATGPVAGWNADGTGYVNLAINLPTTQGTRGTNDNFDDGLLSEYAVNDATLILFENDVIHSAYTLNLPFGMNTENDAITSTAKITQKINKVGGSIKALVVLNNNGLFSVDKEDATLNDADGNSLVGKTLAQLNETLKTNVKGGYVWNSDGFLMSNALLAKSAGGTAEPTTDVELLATIDGDKVYSTQAQAEANPAANIYVERAQAKVTVSEELDKDEDQLATTTQSNLKFSIAGWVLDNTNNSSKLVRTDDGYSTWYNYNSEYSSNYRMVGAQTVGDGLYRVYWGQDYNYENTTDGDLTTCGAGAQITKWNDVDGNAYCFENTTDLDNMLEKNLTRVIVKAKFNNGGDFYTMDNDLTTMWTLENAQQTIATRVLEVNEVHDYLTAHTVSGQTIDATDFDVTLEPSIVGNTAVGGDVTIKVALKESSKSKLDDSDNLPDLTTIAQNRITAALYKDGVAYYSVWVSHFYDDYTLWERAKVSGNSLTIDNIYYYEDNTKEANFLGRWGMLRNNWYQLSITSVKGLGTPSIEAVTGEPVDKVENYISFRINILPWAVRKQSVEL